MSTNHSSRSCDFCGKHSEEVGHLVMGDEVAICDECVELCSSLLIKKRMGVPSGDLVSLNPVKIKQYLDQYIIGQDNAKIGLAVGVSQHYKRLRHPSTEVTIDKSNILIMGPTGTGKSALLARIAEYLDVPFALCDATGLSQVGYAGADPESVLARLVAVADGDIERAQTGIIYIDEIDKITKKNEGQSNTKDVSGECVQQGLLKMIEGTVAQISLTEKRKHPNKETVSVDTSNILFIVGGAFVGLDKIINQRKATSTIGFNGNPVAKSEISDTIYDEATVKDLITYGMIPEFIGRFGITINVNALSIDELVDILTTPKNSIVQQYKYLFKLDGINLEFTDDALKSIAIQAKELNTNARGLKQIIEKCLLQYQYQALDLAESGISKIIITEETTRGGEALLK